MRSVDRQSEQGYPADDAIHASPWLPVALRAWTEIPPDPEQPGKRRRKNSADRPEREDEHVLVIDTETTIDRSQRLNFGIYRYYRTRRHRSGAVTLIPVDEGIFHEDDLPARDPDGYRLLWEYATYREPDIDPDVWDSAISFRLLTASEMRDLLYVAAYQLRALVVCFNLPFDLSRLAIGWAPTRGGKTRKQRQESSFQGGFTLRYFEHDGKPNRYRPELQIKTIDSKRALKRFNVPHRLENHHRGADGKPFRGHLLDLRTIAFALTDQGHTLESACDAFGVPYTKREVVHGSITTEYIDYCREDVAATAGLFEAISAEYHRHPIQLQITKAFSPASIGKAYLKAMGVKPVIGNDQTRGKQPDFPRDVLGWAMSAYYGGRAECRIRRVSVPVVYLDFLSMYPTVNALMGLWRHVTAARIETRDVTDDVRALVERVTVKDALDPDLWRELPALVQINPDGDVLPVRARYGKSRSWRIGSNPLCASEPMWYALPDVIASKLITGRAPDIIRAIGFEPSDRQRGLKPVRLRGEIEVDPRKDDLFRAAIEQRRQLEDKTDRLGRFLKTFSNATSYGIYAEMTRHELPAGQRRDVTVYSGDGEPFSASTAAPEQPGVFAFPPMAATITAAARLMLATLEALVTEAGGTWAFCDTDSMAIVATEHGGLVPCPSGPERDEHASECVRALTWAQVDAIVGRFESLNPYDRGIVMHGSVLEIEDENYELDPADHKRVLKERRQLHCYSISAKRYGLYNLDSSGRPTLRRVSEDDRDGLVNDEPDESVSELRKHSEHGLGHLLNPTDPESDSRDWIAQIWQHIVQADALGFVAPEPDWLDRPALTRITITSPRLLKPFEQPDRKRSASERTRPYNFMLVAHVAKLGHPPGSDPERFLLVAPYEPNPRKWRGLNWRNAYDPARRYRIMTLRGDRHDGERIAMRVDDQVIVKTYRDVLDEYRTHPEDVSLGPNLLLCDQQTVGLLSRRPVKVAAIHQLGKEGNQIEEVASGLVTSLDDVLNEYGDREQSLLWRIACDVIRELPIAQVAAGAGVGKRTVERARSRHEKRLWISDNAQGDQCGHRHRHITEAALCGRSWERYWRRKGMRQTWNAKPVTIIVCDHLGDTTRTKLTAHVIKRAKVELRAAAIQPPQDPEALLAAYLELLKTADPEECACGCGQPVERAGKGQASMWYSDGCRKRAARTGT